MTGPLRPSESNAPPVGESTAPRGGILSGIAHALFREWPAFGSWLRSSWARLLIEFELILLVYVLSIGPMYWKIHEAYNVGSGSPFIARMYYPLVKASEWSDTVSDVLDWYVGLWIFGEFDNRSLPPLHDEPAMHTAAVGTHPD